MMSMAKVPVGYHFTPSDQELLVGYLRRKLLGQALPCDVVVERELYGDKANPWEVFREDDDHWESSGIGDDSSKAKKQKIMYVFTKLSKIKKGNKNNVRTAGCGTWHGNIGAKDIVIGKAKIGTKRTFTYKPSSAAKEDLDGKGQWRLHEYSLSDAGLEDIGSTNYVICKVMKEESSWSKILKKQTAAEIEAEAEADLMMMMRRNHDDDQVLMNYYSGKSSEISTTTSTQLVLGKRKSREEDVHDYYDYIPQEKKSTSSMMVVADHHGIADFGVVGSPDGGDGDDACVDEYASLLEDMLLAGNTNTNSNTNPPEPIAIGVDDNDNIDQADDDDGVCSLNQAPGGELEAKNISEATLMMLVSEADQHGRHGVVDDGVGLPNGGDGDDIARIQCASLLDDMSLSGDTTNPPELIAIDVHQDHADDARLCSSNQAAHDTSFELLQPCYAAGNGLQLAHYLGAHTSMDNADASLEDYGRFLNDDISEIPFSGDNFDLSLSLEDLDVPEFMASYMLGAVFG